jgi:hypothetical protein
MAQIEPIHEVGSWEKLIVQASYGSQFEDDFKSNYNSDEKCNVKPMMKDRKLQLIV